MARALQRVVVGMSGGVDSAVTAWLLKRQGHDVHGLFVQSWDSRDETGACQADDDWRQVQVLCEQLVIPCERVSFVATFWTDVFEPMLAEYAAGRTPNPDVDCNRRLKFAAVAQLATRNADAFATGHYARLETPGPRLLRSPAHCDQTLFLSGVTSAQLARVQFPLGAMTKPQVRALAREAGLPNAERRSSTGICFVGKRRFGEFLAQYAQLTPGAFVDADSGAVVGHHNGAQQFTVGQRARIGGEARPLYVSHVNATSGDVLVAPREHASFFCTVLHVEPFHWIAGEAPRQVNDTRSAVRVQCRHMGELYSCTIASGVEGDRLLFPKRVPRVAAGQTVALYDGDWCLGNAVVAAARKH